MPLAPNEPVIVDFPLRGEGWVAVNSPGDRVPSHGTDMLGQRYAFDFVRVDERKALRVHPASGARAWLFGVPTKECYAWGVPIYAPLDGEVIAAVDGIEEPSWLHPVRDAGRAMWNGVTFRPEHLPRVLGNHVILRCGELFAAFAHLAPGSVAVAPGQAVARGELLGRVGHTGNSTSPHLHFQLMDAADPLRAKGVPCAFRAYEVRTRSGWRRVEDGIPRRRQRIRSVPAGEP
ncbi:MAG: M23 family metallopeptidase [Dehalococcoidia bacterium]|nr:M23 family metallopeptidase [Dehalococcoidia bacterium]